MSLWRHPDTLTDEWRSRENGIFFDICVGTELGFKSVRGFEMSGQRTSNPQQTLQLLMAKKEKLQEELRSVEKQVYDLETTYLHDSSQSGNVLKGFEGFLSSGKGAGNLKRPRKFQPEDRLFSLSSVTSPAMDEHAAGRDSDGRMDGMGPGRKAGGTPTNGPGKPKRGRTGPREGKRIKQVNEQELEEEDDADGLPRQLLAT